MDKTVLNYATTRLARRRDFRIWLIVGLCLVLLVTAMVLITWWAEAVIRTIFEPLFHSHHSRGTR